METIEINKQAVADLIRIKDEFDSIIESIELSGDLEFIESYNKAKNQIRNRDFADWNGL